MKNIACCLLLLLCFHPTLAEEPADIIFCNGKIVTVDKAFSIASSLAVRGGKIVAVGNFGETKKFLGEDTQVIDLAGKMMLPGLMDSHVHPHGAAMHEFDHEIPDLDSIEAVLKYIQTRAAVLPAGKWIAVRQVFITRLREPRYPTKGELDAAAPEHPVVFSTGPDAMLNSLALKLSEIDRDFKLTGTGSIEKDASGEPTGLLRSCARYIKSTSSDKKATEEDRQSRLEQLFRAYNAVGLTCVADRNAGIEDVQRYQALQVADRLTVRMRASVSIDNSAKLTDIEERLKMITQHPARKENPQVQIIGVKTFLDGGMLTGSAYMREPWGVSKTYSITDPRYRGVLFIEPEKLEKMVRATVENGLQFTAHSVGDAAVHHLLDAYEAVNKTLPVKGTRPCLTHSNFMSREAVEQMARLGVVADIQPAWLYLDAKVLQAQFGNERLRYFQPLKTIFELNAIAGGGSDHMQKIGPLRSTNPYHPFLGMWVTITRRSRWLEEPLHSEEALIREQAIRFYTMNNAYLLFLEHLTGSLEPGKLADMIVLDRDLLTCPIDDIRETRVLKTYLGGKLVFAAK